MKIRLATTSDFPAIKVCEERAFDMSPETCNVRDKDQCAILATQIRNGDIHLVYNAAGTLGYISFMPCADHIFVDTIAVLPDHHGKGVGTMLLDHAETTAAALGLGSVKLFTDGTIEENVRFYSRRGYDETDRCEEGTFSRIFYGKAIAA